MQCRMEEYSLWIYCAGRQRLSCKCIALIPRDIYLSMIGISEYQLKK